MIALCCNHAYALFEFVSNKTSEGVLDDHFFKELKNTFQPDIFFETGTYSGETTMAAIPYFKELVSVEFHEGLAEVAKRKFSEFTQVRVFYGQSPDLIRTIAPALKGTILFWLDAHYSGEGTALSSNDLESPDAITAIRNELSAIQDTGIQDCVILIDDIRGFGTEVSGVDYMGCWAYPSIQEVEKAILKINLHFELALVGDILLAYDKTKYQPQFSEAVKACTKTRLYDGENLTDSELQELEKTIMHASFQEKQCIKKLYSMMTGCKDPMFLHDLWYGLIELGDKNYTDAYRAFLKVKIRTQFLNKNGQPDNKVLPYNHPRIDQYLQNCLSEL